MLYDKELPLQIGDTQSYVAGQRTSSEMSYSFIVYLFIISYEERFRSFELLVCLFTPCIHKLI